MDFFIDPLLVRLGCLICHPGCIIVQLSCFVNSYFIN
nr:MAG TPA: hypothetical protein [Caudoviricetes sp.]